MFIHSQISTMCQGVYIYHLNFQNPIQGVNVCVVIIPILQIWKLKFKMAK